VPHPSGCVCLDIANGFGLNPLTMEILGKWDIEELRNSLYEYFRYKMILIVASDLPRTLIPVELGIVFYGLLVF
jgi:hypothetical protein